MSYLTDDACKPAVAVGNRRDLENYVPARVDEPPLVIEDLELAMKGLYGGLVESRLRDP
jgi:hypothetical protein